MNVLPSVVISQVAIQRYTLEIDGAFSIAASVAEVARAIIANSCAYTCNETVSNEVAQQVLATIEGLLAAEPALHDQTRHPVNVIVSQAMLTGFVLEINNAFTFFANIAEVARRVYQHNCSYECDQTVDAGTQQLLAQLIKYRI